MTYNINSTIFSSTYAIPTDVADKYLKIATEVQLKVLLYFMRNISEGIHARKIADAISLPVSEVEDALLFWSQCGILNSEQPKASEPKKVTISSALPSRSDVIRRGLEDEKLMFLLREAQLRFGRNLKQNESQLIVSLYDDYGMKASVILLLLGYSVREGKCNLSFIKKTAAAWISAGVDKVEDAEELIAQETTKNLAWEIVRKVFGIEKRQPSAKEVEYSNLWINEWKMSADLLKAAYDVCIDSKTKLSFAYVAKIIESWHKDGITVPEQIADKKQKAGDSASTSRAKIKNDYAGYDLDQYEQMLNNKIKDKGATDDDA